MIHYESQNIEMPEIDQKRISRWLSRVAASYDFSIGNLNYIFCNDEHELAVNREFLGHDYYTDVITFDYTTGKVISGDIFISLDTVKSNASDLGLDYMTELHRIIVHGLLHLTGQGDKTPESKLQMTQKEDIALKLLGK